MTDLTPPPELLERWEEDWHHSKVKHIELEDHIATEAARWGADKELEACCEWLLDHGYDLCSPEMRTARRPKPPTLKEQALAVLDDCSDRLDAAHENALRRALETLDD